MDTPSYVLTVSEGPGIYRHIRISSDATLWDLHDTIAETFDLASGSWPSFELLKPYNGMPRVKYATNSTKTTMKMRDVKLADTGFSGTGILIYRLQEPRIALKCRTLKVLKEGTAAPEVIKASGSLNHFNIAFGSAVRSLFDKRAREGLDAVMAFSRITEEAVPVLTRYFLASANLHGLVPIKTIYDYYISNRPPLSFEAFCMFGIIMGTPKQPRAYVLDEKGGILTAENFRGRQAFYIADLTVVESDFFAEMLRAQKGKPYYLPAEDEFLRYESEDYIEENESYRRLLAFLMFLGLAREKAREIMLYLVDSMRFTDDKAAQFFDILHKHRIVLKDLKEMNRALGLYSDLNNHTRSHFNRGHTPAEIVVLLGARPAARRPEAPPPTDFSGFSRQSASLIPFPRPAAKKTGRNDPCPCGSGKKYKYCCGRPGVENSEGGAGD